LDISAISGITVDKPGKPGKSCAATTHWHHYSSSEWVLVVQILYLLYWMAKHMLD